MGYRIEYDSIGEVQVDESRFWGAQTERSLHNFAIGNEKMPTELIRALIRIKHAACQVNYELGKLNEKEHMLITETCQDLLTHDYKEHFPLSVWQTGSGTQTNMNVNEVIAHIANKRAGEEVIHPNDHVNMGQSSNDVFPSATHLAAYEEIHHKLLPAIEYLRNIFHEKAQAFQEVVKIGRTHLQDATPLTVGQEISAWETMLTRSIEYISNNSEVFTLLAIGGTAVGTGVNTSKDFGKCVAEVLSTDTTTYNSDENKFYQLTSRDSFVLVHGAVEALAMNLHKIANDIRMLSMGPRAGIGELSIPANEPGSSIMPGKVNPTQAEQMTMVSARVMGNQTSIAFAASQGQFQLNVYTPLIIYSFLQSIQLLTDSMRSFANYCALGIDVNTKKINEHLENSLMLVTALSPEIGYKKAAQIAKLAFEEERNLREVALEQVDISEEKLDQLLDPKNMI